MRRARRTTGGLAAALVCVAAGGAIEAREAAALPAPPFEIAVQDDAVFLSGGRGYSDARAFRQAEALGATRLRVGMTWAQAVRRRRGNAVTYRFRAYDRLVAAARQRGMRVQIVLLGTPRYDRDGDRWLSHRAPRPERMARFAGDVARHFRGQVDRYSVWNEPNSETFLAPQRVCRDGRCDLVGARIYRTLVEAAHPAIKAADPDAQVLVGETAPDASASVVAPLAFLREATCAGPTYAPARPCAPLVADGYAHHPYQFRDAPDRPTRAGTDQLGMSGLFRLDSALGGLRDSGLLATPAGEALPVYLTEFGYYKVGSRRGGLSEANRADWLRRAFDAAAGFPFVRQMTYFHLVDGPPGVRFNTGIVGRNGRPSAAFEALRRWQMAGRRGRPAPPGGR